jgi:hypothetical protein
VRNFIIPFLISFGMFFQAHADEANRLIGTYESPMIYYGGCRGHDMNKYPPTFFGQPILKNSVLSIFAKGNNTIFLSLSTSGKTPLEIKLADKNIISWVNSWENSVHEAQLLRDTGTSALLQYSLVNTKDGSYAGSFWFFQDSTDLSISLTMTMNDWCELKWEFKK